MNARVKHFGLFCRSIDDKEKSFTTSTAGNMICLAVFTLAEGFLLGCVAATYTAEEVLMAIGICSILVISLTLFAWQTKIDFTAMGGVLLVSRLLSML
jgi:FtsH-binding integral membrane protein